MKKGANIQILKLYSNMRIECEYSNIRIFVDIHSTYIMMILCFGTDRSWQKCGPISYHIRVFSVYFLVCVVLKNCPVELLSECFDFSDNNLCSGCSKIQENYGYL